MDCVFCNIAKGFAPAEVRHENADYMAFTDMYPRAETHLLVIPRAHHENLDTWLEAGSDSDGMLAFVAEVARQAGVSGRYRLVTNVGRDAGQLVFHLHWHMLAGAEIDAF